MFMQNVIKLSAVLTEKKNFDEDSKNAKRADMFCM